MAKEDNHSKIKMDPSFRWDDDQEKSKIRIKIKMDSSFRWDDEQKAASGSSGMPSCPTIHGTQRATHGTLRPQGCDAPPDPR